MLGLVGTGQLLSALTHISQAIYFPFTKKEKESVITDDTLFSELEI